MKKWKIIFGVLFYPYGIYLIWKHYKDKKTINKELEERDKEKEQLRRDKERRKEQLRKEREKKERIRQQNEEKERIRQQNEEIERMNKLHTQFLSDYDKDGNGTIDVIEGDDDFMKLLKKHHDIIKEFDKQYMNNFVKISNYLKIKRGQIQTLFTEIKNSEVDLDTEDNIGLLKNQVHLYQLVLFNSLGMIISIVENDLITLNEIYEEFDKLEIFQTDYQRKMSQKLSEIRFGIYRLLKSIDSMERNIVNGLNNLTYVTQDGFSDLNNSLSVELKSINSSIDSNNLLTFVQNYQMYKINQNTKGLKS